MYSYSITATLVNASAHLDFTQKTAVLDHCAAQFSQKSASAANPKALKVRQVTPDAVLLELSSTLPLEHPGKALRLYSRLVLEQDADFYGAVTTSGRLFRISDFPPVPATPAALCSEDRELLKAIVDAVWSGDPRLAELKARARELGLLN